MLSLIFFYIHLTHASFITTPDSCIDKQQYPCTVVTLEKSKFVSGRDVYYFSANSFFIMNSKNSFELFRGSVWGRVKSPVDFKTKYGRIYARGPDNREFLISGDVDSYKINVVRGDLFVHPKGGAPLSISMGRGTVLSSVDYALQTCSVRTPRVIDFHEYIKSFSVAFPFGFLSLEKNLTKVYEAILLASHQDSLYLKDAVARRLASVENDRVKKNREEQDARLRDQYLKRLFRIKSNFEEI